MSATSTRPPATRSAVRAAAGVYAGLWIATALALIAGRLAPTLTPARSPHPALRPTLAAALSITLNNARVLAPPFLLSAFSFASARASRMAGDLLTATPPVLLAVNVGLALGRWGERLLPYIPQLPVEYAAAASAASVWLAHRRHPRPSARSLAPSAALTLALLALAAGLELLATPHAR